jgi:uncharacterized damage-inducible protein DinB
VAGKTAFSVNLVYRVRSGGMEIERVIPPQDAAEREMLTAWLDLHRATLAGKCAGLSDDQLREQAVPPSTLSLLGLIRHMAEVEHNWLRPLLAGEPMAGLWAAGPDLNPDVAFDEVGTADVAEAFTAWRAECERASQLADGAESLDVTGMRGGARFSLRWVLVHMIEEYARHNGHADLLRERIDGVTGA